jgi:NarL family two-component system response regulator LiaR
MSTHPPIRIVLVDDQETVWAGLATLFQAYPDLLLVGATGDVREAVHLCCELQPQVVLMDLMLFGKPAGLDASRVIRAALPQVRVVALSSFCSPELIDAAFWSGISSHLVKNVLIDELAHAIRATYQGESTISPQIARQLQEGTKPPRYLTLH